MRIAMVCWFENIAKLTKRKEIADDPKLLALDSAFEQLFHKRQNQGYSTPDIVEVNSNFEITALHECKASKRAVDTAIKGHREKTITNIEFIVNLLHDPNPPKSLRTFFKDDK